MMAPAQVEAATISFTRITSNAATDIASQFSLEVDQSGVAADEVRFKLSGSGPLSFEVGEVYWDDDLGLLAGNLMLIPADTTAGVGYQFTNVNPGNLPGGNGIGFSADFAGDEGSSGGGPSGDPGDGVMAGQMAGFKFDLAMGASLQAVIDAIQGDDLRFGMHVRSIGGGESDGFVTTGVPEPASCIVLLLGGLLSLGVRARR